MRDPLQHGILLPLEGRYYPLGFPLSVRSNCAAVLESVRSSWGDVPPAYSKPLLELHVVVEPGGMPPPPVFRAQRNLMIIAADPHNLAVCDRRGNFAFVNLSSGAFADPEFVRGQFLEAAVFHLLTQSCVTPVHAACVESGGRGILLCGDSGAGKSCLAYTCARAGFTYISDNESWLLRPEECAVVAGDPRRIRFRDTAAELFGELRGRQSYVTPGGKRSVDLPVVGFQGIRRAFRANIAALVWLRRGEAGVKPVERARVLDELMATVPRYEERVSRAHRQSLERLAALPAYSMGYTTPAHGVAELERILEVL